MAVLAAALSLTEIIILLMGKKKSGNFAAKNKVVPSSLRGAGWMGLYLV